MSGLIEIYYMSFPRFPPGEGRRGGKGWEGSKRNYVRLRYSLPTLDYILREGCSATYMYRVLAEYLPKRVTG